MSRWGGKSWTRLRVRRRGLATNAFIVRTRSSLFVCQLTAVDEHTIASAIGVLREHVALIVVRPVLTEDRRPIAKLVLLFLELVAIGIVSVRVARAVRDSIAIVIKA